LSRYHLPVDIETDHEKVFEVMRLDKKRADDQMQFVMLNKIGDACTKPIPLAFLHENIKAIL
jgi:3-dehydroquinate synthetase